MGDKNKLEKITENGIKYGEKTGESENNNNKLKDGKRTVVPSIFRICLGVWMSYGIVLDFRIKKMNSFFGGQD